MKAVDGDQREEHNVRRRSDRVNETVEKKQKEEKWKGIEWTKITEEMKLNNKMKNGV